MDQGLVQTAMEIASHAAAAGATLVLAVLAAGLRLANTSRERSGSSSEEGAS